MGLMPGHSRGVRHYQSRQSRESRAAVIALVRIRLTCIAGSGAAKVAAARSFGLSPGEDTPKAPRAFADPLRLLALAYVDDATHKLDAP